MENYRYPVTLMVYYLPKSLNMKSYPQQQDQPYKQRIQINSK